jgi:hypothetical protein
VKTAIWLKYCERKLSQKRRSLDIGTTIVLAKVEAISEILFETYTVLGEEKQVIFFIKWLKKSGK